MDQPSSPVLSQDSKNGIGFDVRELEMPIFSFQSDVITFTWLLGHCIANNNYIGLKFYTLLLYSSIQYILVFGYLRDFVGIYF